MLWADAMACNCSGVTAMVSLVVDRLYCSFEGGGMYRLVGHRGRN
jgi:hypothetical protein